MSASDGGETEPKAIAVLPALRLGDVLCAVPALRALRRRWAAAHITLIGQSWARELVSRFPGYLDDFMELPGFPGLSSDHSYEPRAAVRFLREAQQRRFDLALQLNGSGEASNVLAALLGARRVTGYFREGEFCPDERSFLPWRDDEDETERGLRLLAALGVPACGAELEAPLLPADRDELAAVAGAEKLVQGTYACIHPGARRLSLRWYPERFALVADELAARGLRIVLTGTAAEAGLARDVVRRMRSVAVNLVGKTTLGALTTLLDGARLLVANDTGVRQIAAARGTPCVAIACGGNARSSAERELTERLLHADVECRPCEFVRCPIGHACAHGVETREVVAAADELLAGTVGRAAQPSYAA